MKAERILFATDFSHCGDEAMALATSLARDTGATILIVHVEEPPAAYGSGHMYYGDPGPTQKELTGMLHRVVPTDPSVPREHHLVMGAPAATLVEFAEKHKVDVIVLGTHGRSGLFRILMGSVAEHVIRHARCPVVTVRHPKHADE
ncbi:MAG: universal stress protein A [Planctomycetaceae bacterium]|jgi:universal stress protein A